MAFLKLMYITNRTDVAALADECGVDRIFIDLEIVGKEDRQANMDTVISRHSIDDISKIKAILKNAELLVRVNPIYSASEREIDECINRGADILMLPYFKSGDEVRKFIKFVNGRAKTCLLVETAEAVEHLDDILNISGIDMMHIGLNDLHLSYGMDFMFELLADGTVEKIGKKIREKGIPYGFGGIARIGKGMLPAEHVIAEHYRLGSEMAILSRSFCNAANCVNVKEIKDIFRDGLAEIYKYEDALETKPDAFFEENRQIAVNEIDRIVEQIRSKK
ncbi:MAG: CoA ester lyase [Ruminococcaceae bacterium]|nr:CoA ester lyase [Oscillospiraceae bacterium]